MTNARAHVMTERARAHLGGWALPWKCSAIYATSSLPVTAAVMRAWRYSRSADI